MTPRGALVQELIDSKKQFSTDDRMRLCLRLKCTMKDLIIAEYKVGVADPAAIEDYLRKNQLI